MESKENSEKHFYLKWPWNVIVYIILAVVLRLFSIPVILFLIWWNKKQQPDGPEDGYCLQKTRGRLIGLIPAAAFIAGGAMALMFFYLGQTLPEEVEQLDDKMRIFYYLCPFLGVGAILIGIFLAFRSLRDVLCPEKSALAQSIRNQLRYPDEAPPVKELFAMVDQDLKQDGQWFGKLGIGKEWVLGDEVSSLPRIRGVFSRMERHTHHSENRTQVTYTYELWIVDDRQHRQVTSLKSKKQLEEAVDCLRQRIPAAVFGVYDSKEYQELVDSKDDMQQYAQERAYQQRKAQFEEQDRQQKEQQSQKQVLTFPDGSVTSRISWDTIRQLLLSPSQTGEASPFQLVPGIPFQGQGHVFSRLTCIPGGAMEQTRILLEEYSGSPGKPGQYAWTRDVYCGEAETVLRGWLVGEIPSLSGWTRIKRDGRTWGQVSERREDRMSPTPPQPYSDWSWQMTAGGDSGSTTDFDWTDIEKAVWELNRESDSYLILEQRSPEHPEQYWFIQCAVALEEPDAGMYAVEIGCSAPDGPRLWERMTSDMRQVEKYFSDAYYHKGLDISGFQEI